MEVREIEKETEYYHELIERGMSFLILQSDYDIFNFYCRGRGLQKGKYHFIDWGVEEAESGDNIPLYLVVFEDRYHLDKEVVRHFEEEYYAFKEMYSRRDN